MKSGELSLEPELHMLDEEPKHKQSAKKPAAKRTPKSTLDIQEDGFFGSDDEV